MTDLGDVEQRTQINGIPRADALFTRLITSPDDQEILTDVRTADARTALARGLAEYLATQKLIWEGGREMAFKSVNVSWAEVEQATEYPSLAVTTVGPGQYDFDVPPRLVQAGTGYLRQTSELQQEFQVTAWANDPMQRVGLGALLEDAMLAPVEFMSGFRLEFPFYFGTRATYLARSVAFQDAPQDAQRRWRLAAFAVTGNVPVYQQLGQLPSMKLEMPTTVE